MRAVDLETFRKQPIGHQLVGHSFALWAWDERLAGSAYFGHPDPRDFPTMIAMMDLPFHAAFAAPIDAVVDCSALVGIDLGAFELLGSHLGEVGRAAERIRRVAVVRPPGIVGATIAGLFYEAVKSRFMAGIFTDSHEAFAWLDRPDAAAAQAAAAELVTVAASTPSWLTTLREHLNQRPNATVAEAARRLAVSPRTLQRQLGEHGTTFRIELERARIRVAEALLTRSNQKLAAIASACGYASPSQLGALFRRVTGETPRQFRDRRKH